MSGFENIVVLIVTVVMFFLIFSRIKSFIKNPSDIAGKAGRNIVEGIYIAVILVLCFFHIKSIIHYRNTSEMIGSYYKQIMMIVAIFFIWISLSVKKEQRKMAALAHIERMSQEFQDDYDDDYDDNFDDDFDDDDVEDEFKSLVDEDIEDVTEDIEDEASGIEDSQKE